MPFFRQSIANNAVKETVHDSAGGHGWMDYEQLRLYSAEKISLKVINQKQIVHATIPDVWVEMLQSCFSSLHKINISELWRWFFIQRSWDSEPMVW